MELRCNFGVTGCGCDVTWIKVRYKHQDLHWGEIWPGWMWDVHLRDLEGNEMGHKYGWALPLQTWMGVRWYLDEIDLQRLMEERRDLEGGETQVPAPGWNWHVNLVTRMEVRWHIEGSDASILESGFRWVRTCMALRHILKPGWVWDSGWLNLRCNFVDLDGGEMYIFNHGWAWDGAGVELRCNLWTWMEVRCHQDGGEMEI